MSICYHVSIEDDTYLIGVSEIYRTLDYSVADLEAAAGGHIAVSDDKATVIMARMRNPSLSIHGIEGAFSGVGAKTVIPASVGGKFSLRLVQILSHNRTKATILIPHVFQPRTTANA